MQRKSRKSTSFLPHDQPSTPAWCPCGAATPGTSSPPHRNRPAASPSPSLCASSARWWTSWWAAGLSTWWEEKDNDGQHLCDYDHCFLNKYKLDCWEDPSGPEGGLCGIGLTNICLSKLIEGQNISIITYSANSPTSQTPICATSKSLWFCFCLLVFSSG